LKTEIVLRNVHIFKDFQEDILGCVSRVFRVTQKPGESAEHSTGIPAHQFLKSVNVPALNASNSCLKEYIHKAVGIVGVSAGPFGGTRVIENLLPVMRELGLVTIFWDVNFSSVQNVFSEDGALRDQSYLRRIDKFVAELIWMATTLRYGREHISLHRPEVSTQ
jgi:hypothetical protein